MTLSEEIGACHECKNPSSSGRLETDGKPTWFSGLIKTGNIEIDQKKDDLIFREELKSN